MARLMSFCVFCHAPAPAHMVCIVLSLKFHTRNYVYLGNLIAENNFLNAKLHVNVKL